jgi:chromosome segregation ATPase
MVAHDLAPSSATAGVGPSGAPTELAHLAEMLSAAYRDADALRKELAHTRRQLDKSERMLSALQAGSPSSASSSSDAAPIPERALKLIYEAESRADQALRERDELSDKLHAIHTGWQDMERYMTTAEVRLADARQCFSRIMSEGAGSFGVAPPPVPQQVIPATYATKTLNIC